MKMARGDMNMKKPYLIAEILINRGLPDKVVKEITAIAESELCFLKRKWGLNRSTNA